MSHDSHRGDAADQSYRKGRHRKLRRAYESLLDDERPVLLVDRTSPVHSGLIPECQISNPLTTLRLWLNRPLLALLNKRAGGCISWSPIWWKDDADPYGRIILWRDSPRGRTRTCLIEDGVREVVCISFLGDRKAQLWLPVAAITHYAVAQFKAIPSGLAFNPLDGFQARTKDIRCSGS